MNEIQPCPTCGSEPTPHNDTQLDLADFLDLAKACDSASFDVASDPELQSLLREASKSLSALVAKVGAQDSKIVELSRLLRGAVLDTDHGKDAAR